MILLSLLFGFARTACVFTVNSDDEIPHPPDNPNPFISSPSSCPYLANTEVCCSEYQNRQMASNFQAIDAAFGSSGGGCDVCANNLKKFWCEYTCSPNQDKFIKDNGQVLIPDPLDSDHHLVLVQNISITIFSETACELFSSCQRTSFASQVSAMQSPGGFFNFQGQNAVSQAKQIISCGFNYDTAQSLQIENITSCGALATNSTTTEEGGKNVTKYWNSDGFQIYQNCSCNNCQESCKTEVFLYSPTGPMEGFNWIMVVSTWGAVIFCVLLLWISSQFQLRRAKRNMVRQHRNRQTVKDPLLNN